MRRVWTSRSRVLLSLVAVAALSMAAASCSSSGDDDGNSGARNSSNFNTRSIRTFGSEVPTYPRADLVTKGAIEAGAWHRTYEVQATAADVLAFYERELPSAGWTNRGTPDPTDGGTESTWRRPGLRLTVTVAPVAAGSTTSAPISGSGSATSTVNLSLERPSGA
jgi:hypothetical protein